MATAQKDKVQIKQLRAEIKKLRAEVTVLKISDSEKRNRERAQWRLEAAAELAAIAEEVAEERARYPWYKRFLLGKF